MFESRAYGLSFRMPKGKEPAAVVVDVPLELCGRVEDLLVRLQRRSLPEWAEKTLGGLATFDLFGDMFRPERFGFGACGRRIVDDTTAHYAVELMGPSHVFAVACTIEHLLTAVKGVGHTARLRTSNAKQLFDAEFGVGQSRQGLGGWFDASVGQWFARRGAEGPGEPTNPFSEGAFAGYPLANDYPKRAMMAAWRAVATKELRPFAGHCAVTVKPAGNFALICLGCNVAAFHDIAPQMDTGYPGRFTCWNLDNVVQSVTCFAGLCALYEVLAQDLG